MRKYALLLIPVLAILAVDASGQAKKAKAPYVVEFDRAKDITQMNVSPDGTKKGIFVKVRFAVTLDGSKVDKLGDDYKLIIEEDGHEVKRVDMPRPVASEDLTVMLALDTSGSMKEHGRMEQARAAADVFLNKLPTGSDCGLVLFDHEIRERMQPIFERPPLLLKINSTQPRGGTAYLDAGSEAIDMLKNTRRGRDRAVVLMTDGIDLNSKKSIAQVIAQAKKERVRVYTVGIGEPGRQDQVNTVLVLDHSGSMKPPASDSDTTPKIQALHLAAERYVDSMSTVGRCSVIPFSTIVETPWPFMEKAQGIHLKSKIRKLLPYGETALIDATYDAICVLEADRPRGKRAVIAMTDGKDNTSRRPIEELLERAQEARIPLYMLGFGRTDEIDEAAMKKMAEATGGKYYHAKNKDALVEIFENLSIQLHDDGIDEVALKRIAQETNGKYFPAKNISELKLILEQVTKSIQREAYEITFESLVQRSDGTQRNVSLKLVRQGAAGAEEVIEERKGSFQVRGLVVAEMNHFVYLGFLLAIGGLIALPALLRRATA
ncbi:MAG TPA: vWA domain-containing protein [Gemmataceae bacterium]|nr:vWA domain-containing protein [Gemmataceae bacterium]